MLFGLAIALTGFFRRAFARRIRLQGALLVGLVWDRVGDWCFSQAAGIFQSAMQNKLDLSVETSEFIVGPSPKCLEDFGLDSQQKTISFCHRLIDPIRHGFRGDPGRY